MKIDRASAIRQHLFAKGQSSIAMIAEAVGASEPTVRRDLALLAAEGAIQRTHGGARIAAGAGVEIAFESREQIKLGAKRAIGAAAYRMLRPDTSIFLDAGTTVLQLARQLRISPLPVRVFTNCLPVAQILMPVEEISVSLIGGTIRARNAAMVGTLAEEALERLWFDQLFLGAGAVSDGGDIFGADEHEARLNTRMVTRTRRCIILADAGKFGEHLTYLVAPLSQGMHVVSEASLGSDWQERLKEIGCGLTLAEAL